MNVTKNEIDKLTFELVLDITPEDYSENVRKKTAEVRRNAEFKGFRKGMVPASLIEKVYGDQILVEAVNQVIGKGLDGYVKENGLHILGEPLSSKNQPEIEWKKGNSFTFVFDLAYYPEVEVETVKEDTILRYDITATAKEKEGMKENLKKYYEEHKEADAEPKTDEDIDKEIADRLKENYRQQSEWRLNKDIRSFYIQKAGIELPEEFMKRWLLASNEGKVTEEEVEKEFPAFLEDFKWQLVRNSMMKKYEFKIEIDDIKQAARSQVLYQYAMYGMTNVPDEILNDAVDHLMNDSRQIDRIAETVEDEKVISKIKETATFKGKKISSEKFYELK